ncbi:MAG: D-glycero-beta-D-manno-heptose 1,7-bisphosphate 7-phosphatase [Veillonellaceae bacterium]|nr:D-glycero-beta-D-manno-heptose 1,7-bisphosphate 7-phosphatase [Veillonellaceae bacterium]
MDKAVFFDRDGTLNVDGHYIYRIEDFKWMPDAAEAIRYCHDKGYLVIVVTNQSGVARGYYTEDDVHALHEYMNDELQRLGTSIDAFYYCPHHPEAKIEKYRIDCDCRKPKPGMVLKACHDFGIDMSKSYMIGDKKRDVECGERAGVRGILYKGGSLLKLLQSLI